MLRELPGNWEQVTAFWKEIGIPDARRDEHIEWYEAEPTLSSDDEDRKSQDRKLGRRNHLLVKFCEFTCDVQPTSDV